METDLIPPGAELDPDMIELMRLVFHADGTKRASARDLLVHPLIIEGEYVCSTEFCPWTF